MKAHGLYSVMGNFGSGKTFGTFLDLYGLDSNENYIIANVPYPKVDLFFSEKQDLYRIITQLEEYCQDTNYDIVKYYNEVSKLKNVILVVDEAHLYFPARGRKEKNNLRDKISTLVSQCRKRNIKIYIISQRLKLVDLNFRRYSDFIIQYRKRSFMNLIHRCHRMTYENEGDISDIQGDEQKSYVVSSDGKSGPKEALLHKELFYPLTTFFRIFSRYSKTYKEISKYAYCSLFISGLKVKDEIKQFNPNDLYKGGLEETREQNPIEQQNETEDMIRKQKQNDGMNEKPRERIGEQVSPFIVKNQDGINLYSKMLNNEKITNIP